MKNDITDFLSIPEELQYSLEEIICDKQTENIHISCRCCLKTFTKIEGEIYHGLKEPSYRCFICDECFSKYTVKEMYLIIHNDFKEKKSEPFSLGFILQANKNYLKQIGFKYPLKGKELKNEE